MKLKLTAALLGAAVLITGCTHADKSKPIKAGTVVGKAYAQPWDEPVQLKQADGSYSSPVLEHHDECWSLAFTAHGDWNFACVTKDVYDATNLGDWYGS